MHEFSATFLSAPSMSEVLRTALYPAPSARASDGSRVSSDVTSTLVINSVMSLDSTFNAQDNISLNQSINVDPEDVGKPGELFIVVLFNGKPYIRESGGKFKPWNGTIATLEPVEVQSSLSVTQLISVVENLKGIKGDFSIYSGYISNSRLVYSNIPFQFSID